MNSPAIFLKDKHQPKPSPVITRLLRGSRAALLAILLAAIPASFTTINAVEKHPFNVDDLLSLERVSDPQVSPDGQSIAFTISRVDISKNASTSQIWIMPSEGGKARQLTYHEKGASRPRWSPDGKKIAFLSSRSGTQQIWVVAAKGGEARQITRLSTGADNHLWSPTGDFFVFNSDVWPDLNGDAAQKKRQQEMDNSGVQAQVIDQLLYRHWKEWRYGKRTHVFSVSAGGGESRDLTPGDIEAPPFSLGGPDGFSVSPDGRLLVFTRSPVKPGTTSSRDIEAWSTDANLCLVPTTGGDSINLTPGNKGWDGSPVWSPDGRFIAYRSQARDGYESDKFRLAVLERSTGLTQYLAGDIDRSADEIFWAPDGKTIYFNAENEGTMALFAVTFDGGRQAGPTRKLLGGLHFGGLSPSTDGSFIVGTLDSLVHPAELARVNMSEIGAGSNPVPRIITHINDARLSNIAMPVRETIHYTGGLGASVQAWVLLPPGYVSGHKYPFLLVIHGGPQSAWMDAFSYRWNSAVMSARGYVVMQVNPHGSTGFGQAYTEQISGDWGGACYTDLMKGTDWAITEGLADPARMGALGGSYGGYMVNWILGHTNRFKALVSHAGVYNLESMYGSTEELWFPEWDLRGTAWKNNGDYERFSPHKFAANFHTPTLVTHGQLDFRVPIEQGMQLFTALRRQGVESRLLYYPDEGHWILKPKNSRLFYQTALDWLDGHLMPK